MEATQVDAVLDALVTQLHTDIPSAQVVDGEPLNLDRRDVLAVGYSANRVGVEIVQERAGLSDTRRSESLSIVCLASSASGSVGFPSVRKNALDVLRAVVVSLEANRRLGGLVRRAEVGFEMAVDQVLTDIPGGGGRGPAVTVEFTIRVLTH